jgi:hypothetical protein
MAPGYLSKAQRQNAIDHRLEGRKCCSGQLANAAFRAWNYQGSNHLIRDAQMSDVPRIVEMGRHFLKGSTYEKHLSENPDRMAELAEKLISVNGLIVSQQGSDVMGMLGWILHSHFISGDLMAGEVFWWTEPEMRGDGIRLLKEAERRAIAAGAKSFQMIAPNDKVANVYKRLGFDFVEATWQKSL